MHRSFVGVGMEIGRVLWECEGCPELPQYTECLHIFFQGRFERKPHSLLHQSDSQKHVPHVFKLGMGHMPWNLTFGGRHRQLRESKAQPGLHTEFQTGQGNRGTQCLKDKQNLPTNSAQNYPISVLRYFGVGPFHKVWLIYFSFQPITFFLLRKQYQIKNYQDTDKRTF